MDESVIKHLEQPKIGTLKLSQAIREGCKISAPTHDIRITAWVEWDENRCFSCVVGAAWLGATGGDRDHYWRTVGDRIGKTAQMLGVPLRVLHDAQQKYETYRWTREDVADWLESQGY